MKLLIPFLVLLMLSGCGTVRVVRKNCQPVLAKQQLDVVKMINDPDQEWGCDQSIWER